MRRYTAGIWLAQYTQAHLEQNEATRDILGTTKDTPIETMCYLLDLPSIVYSADITSGLQLGRAEKLQGLRNFLNKDRLEHHSTDHSTALKERGVEKGSGRHSTLQSRERFVFNLANISTVSMATLGRLLRDGAERVWAFPSATMPS